MYNVAGWLCKNGFRVREYNTEKEALCAPNLVWWIFLYTLRGVARAAFVSLQGLSRLVKQQGGRFAGLVERLPNMSGALGPMCTTSLKDLDFSKHEVNVSFVISHSSAEKYVTNWIFGSQKSPVAH